MSRGNSFLLLALISAYLPSSPFIQTTSFSGMVFEYTIPFSVNNISPTKSAIISASAFGSAAPYISLCVFATACLYLYSAILRSLSPVFSVIHFLYNLLFLTALTNSIYLLDFSPKCVSSCLRIKPIGFSAYVLICITPSEPIYPSGDNISPLYLISRKSSNTT